MVVLLQEKVNGNIDGSCSVTAALQSVDFPIFFLSSSNRYCIKEANNIATAKFSRASAHIETLMAAEEHYHCLMDA